MIKKKKEQKPPRNWALVVIASIMIVINLALLVIAVAYWSNLGWWAPALIVGAIASLFLSVEAIRKNDPAWLMLDLILPG
jgi:hypothetical protein